ncbi:MAG: DUF1674 domain-containing protein [Geminicoccaceae bacterium]
MSAAAARPAAAAAEAGKAADGGEALTGNERRQEVPPVPPRGPEQPPGEVDGPPGPEPTRFGDWEKGGRCTDF